MGRELDGVSGQHLVDHGNQDSEAVVEFKFERDCSQSAEVAVVNSNGVYVDLGYVQADIHVVDESSEGEVGVD